MLLRTPFSLLKKWLNHEYLRYNYFQSILVSSIYPQRFFANQQIWGDYILLQFVRVHMFMNSMKNILVFVKFWGFFHLFPKWNGRKYFFCNGYNPFFPGVITVHGRNMPTLIFTSPSFPVTCLNAQQLYEKQR